MSLTGKFGTSGSVPGGLRLSEWTGRAPPRTRKSKAQLELPRKHKQAIAELAARLIQDDMMIFQNAGTTCQSVVPHLGARKNLTVLTNNFYVVTSLFTHPHGNDGKGPELAWLVAHLTRANAVFLMICPPVQDQHQAR
ncbi:DeoR/GlpR transcriptional regulator [Arthrobacter sp. ISL-85]|uniref:hypothetical protein n=1 Tax=Arthrobacter sp. ISL-85 TaxID=2819115 RepID=UPI001BE63C77|nr:hypothetical protein [Arthrobacter sp. ISL-85]MBT2565235.1 DeoR/GlpR transcriptional regulator [Arthrobacter sp. ISL-85]